jgi:large subunit ribosomal protein L31
MLIFQVKFYNIKYMKEKIHPPYYKNAKVKCACGNTFEVGSTKEFIEIEICSKCHPFYTKKEKIVDTLGQVQKYKRRLEKKK